MPTSTTTAFKISVQRGSSRDSIPSGLRHEAEFGGRAVEVKDDKTLIVTWPNGEPDAKAIADLRATVTKYNGCTLRECAL